MYSIKSSHPTAYVLLCHEKRIDPRAQYQSLCFRTTVLYDLGVYCKHIIDVKVDRASAACAENVQPSSHTQIINFSLQESPGFVVWLPHTRSIFDRTKTSRTLRNEDAICMFLAAWDKRQVPWGFAYSVLHCLQDKQFWILNFSRIFGSTDTWYESFKHTSASVTASVSCFRMNKSWCK